jgi:hypothetical protein
MNCATNGVDNACELGLSPRTGSPATVVEVGPEMFGFGAVDAAEREIGGDAPGRLDVACRVSESLESCVRNRVAGLVDWLSNDGGATMRSHLPCLESFLQGVAYDLYDGISRPEPSPVN